MIEPVSKTRRRVAGPLLRALPDRVSERVKALADGYGIKSASVVVYPYGWKVYAAEGDRFELIMGEQSASIEMVSERTLGAAGLSHDIGATGIPPVGAWIIRIHYYTKYWMEIINIADSQLETGGVIGATQYEPGGLQ